MTTEMIVIPEELGDHLLSLLHDDLRASKALLNIAPWKPGALESQAEEDDVKQDIVLTEQAIEALNKALGYSEPTEDHLKDCEGPGTSPLCEDYDCQPPADDRKPWSIWDDPRTYETEGH